jgi:large subunit ribosomal protein L10
MIQEDKEKVVAELHKVFTEAKGVFLTDFTGITVESINELRRQLAKENVQYHVVKNTLARRSIQGLPVQNLESYLTGPTGISYSFDDALLPGKALKTFRKKTDLMPLKAAVIGGAVYDSDTAEKMLTLPSKEVLVAKLLGTLNAPIPGLVFVLSGVLRNFVCVLDVIRKKKECEGETKKIPSGMSASADSPEPADSPEVVNSPEPVNSSASVPTDSSGSEPLQEAVPSS